MLFMCKMLFSRVAQNDISTHKKYLLWQKKIFSNKPLVHSKCSLKILNKNLFQTKTSRCPLLIRHTDWHASVILCYSLSIKYIVVTINCLKHICLIFRLSAAGDPVSYPNILKYARHIFTRFVIFYLQDNASNVLLLW